jgi:cupin superfamily acireductone dioxygenase involved in methionine salvage
MHPHADEFIYLLSGETRFELQSEEGITSIRLQDRGALVVPKGVWHTAKVATPSRMLIITLGAGTQHRPVGADGDHAA